MINFDVLAPVNIDDDNKLNTIGQVSVKLCGKFKRNIKNTVLQKAKFNPGKSNKCNQINIFYNFIVVNMHSL